jgi:hypothetical protein
LSFQSIVRWLLRRVKGCATRSRSLPLNIFSWPSLWVWICCAWSDLLFFQKWRLAVVGHLKHLILLSSSKLVKALVHSVVQHVVWMHHI